MIANEKRTTERKQRQQEQAEKRLAASKGKIEKVSNLDTITNQKAREAMRAYIEHGRTSDEFGLAIIELANIISHCKLNRLIEKESTYKDELNDIKHDITASSKYYTYLQTLDGLYTSRIDKNGNVKIECTDKKRVAQIYKLIENLAGKTGNDLVSDCYFKLLAILDRKEKNGEPITENTLLDAFQVYDLRSKTYRNGDVKPKELWTAHNSNAVKEASKTVSRSINAERAVREQSKLYQALERTITNEYGELETIVTYRKAVNLSAYEITDINGKQFSSVSDERTNELFESIPERADLTSRETYIFIKHYGEQISLKEIAEKLLKISVEMVEKSDRNLRNKIVNANIFPQFAGVERNKQNASKKIACYRLDDETKSVIATFESARTASKILNINHALVVQVANGKRKSASGLVFKYID